MVWQKETYDFNESDTVLQKTPYVFDVSVWELLLPLISGSKLLFAKVNGHKEPAYLHTIIKRQKVTKLHFVPSMLNGFIAYLKNNNDNKLPFVKSIFCSGEALPIQLANDFKNLFPSIKLNNLYGPTEVAIDVSSYDDIKSNATVIPIGKPIQNIKFYVLNANIQAVPIGVVGELFIGAQDLSRGYLNRPELTAEKFITNPFATDDDLAKGYNKLYKTGDLVRWLPDGNIEYIGRNDFQVKIRGFRIELGEIENTLVAIDGITQACVLAKERNGNKYLAAYFTSELAITEEVLIKILSAQLPEYMVPSAFVALESFPLTINGKLDRKALPDPDFTDESSYVAPTSDLEIKLCGIWQAVLNLEKIGISDDFFRIGGDSILSIQLSSRLRKHGLNCSVSAIFDHRTVQQLAQFIASEVDTVQILAEQGNLEGAFDLLPIQQWFFDKVDAKQLPEYNHWNQSFLVKVPELEVEKLQKIIEALAAQHDILRTNFSATVTKQRYSTTTNVPQLHRLNVSDLSKEAINERLTNWQSHFDIHKGPLWSVAYLEGYADKTARLYFALHHLIVDAVSWRILIEDFQSLYNNETLGDKSSSYRQWVDEISKYEEKHPKEKAYWDSVLKTMPTYDVLEKQAAFSNIEISQKLTGDLLQQANKAYHTEVNDLLLTALGLTLQSWNKKTRNVITLEGHGREQLNETIDHSKTVGWFTTMYPVELSVEDNLESSIKGIKESLRAIPNKGIGFGAIYPNGYINLPSITFNYLGQFDTQDGYWQVLSENSGIPIHINNIESDIINITGMVTDGQLNFSIISQLGENETMEFSRNFQRHLEDIVAHCLNKINNKETKHTPSDFETVTISESLLDKIQKDRQVESIYLANSLQQGFIYHALSQAEDDAYRGQFLFDYNQTLNIDNYIQSWELAIEKYPILRTGFNWEESLIQVVYSTAKLNCRTIDISALSQTEREEHIINLQQEDRTIAFDLTQPCLLRLYIIRQSVDHYTILKSEHHSIMDGWSGPLLLNNVHKNYIELQQNRPVKIAVDTAYLEAQNFFAKHIDIVKAYWQTKKRTIVQTNDLNPLLSCKQVLDTVKTLAEPSSTSIEITGEQYVALKNLTKREGLPLNTLIQFAWHKLIQVYTQDTQTIVGTTISGRAIPVSGIEASVGLFINTLPLIIDWDNDHTVLEQIQYIHQQITDLNSHSFANLASLQEEGKRLFHSLLVFENYPIPAKSENPSADDLSPEYQYSVEKLDYPLGLTAHENGTGLVINLQSDKTLLSEEKSRYHLEKIKLILDELIVNLNKKHHSLSTLTPLEYEQIVLNWNKINLDYPKDKTICQLFEDQSLKTPNNIAIVFEAQQFTYAELNAKANQLARYLQSQTTINPDTLIALCLDRSPEMIIGILGILKTGGAYVPIDPEYPSDRILYMLRDTNTPLVLTQSGLVEKLEQVSDVRLIALDLRCYETELTNNLPQQNKATDLAYVIYTSGTAGLPKGVMNTHRNITSLVLNNFIEVEDHDSFVLLSSPVFDASTFEIWMPLCYGAKLVIPLNTMALASSSSCFKTFLDKNNISILWLTKTLFNTIFINDPSALSNLKYLLVGGEALDVNIINSLISTKEKASYTLNGYGPTESTTFATTYLIEDQIESHSVPIGKGIDNRSLYVVDKNMSPVPIGVIGELLIGGAGLARGYLNQEALTAQKFISNPFASKTDIENGYTQLYKTGDLVRWLPDGNLEYIGRNDFQVKIRGYRIELGEIENALVAIDGITQACVLAKEKNGNKYLVAYFTSEVVITEEAILKTVSVQLPEYMVPNAFVQLESFPLTINGKLDRKVLPDPEFTNEVSYIAPTSDLEIKLCDIWQAVLNLEKVGVSDNFFRIGGNSIQAIKLLHKISKVLNIHIAVSEIFNYKTIANLAKFIEENSAENITITPQNKARYPLSFAQERLWFIEQYEQGTNAYHIPLFVELQENIKKEKLKEAIQKVFLRHDILRTILTQKNGTFSQEVIDEALIINSYHYLETDLEAQKERDVNTPFNLQDEIPIRVSFYHHDNRVMLLVNIHHIASDGWSLDILLNEIRAIYNDDILPNLPIQYKDFAAWQRNYLDGEILEKQSKYWQEKLKGYEPLSLPTDKARPKEIDYTGADVAFTIEKELSNNLRELSKELGVTLYTTLLSGFYILLSKYSSQDDIIVGTPIANRNYSEIKDLIGFFVNSLALRENINAENNAKEFISQVQNNLIKVQRYQDMPFEKIVESLNVERDTSRHPIFQVMFSLQSFGNNASNELFKHLEFADTHSIENHDLSCFIDDSQNEIKGAFNFATSIYKESTINRMVRHYLLILKQMVNNQNKQLKNYSLLNQEEYNQIVIDWNKTDSHYPKDKTMSQLFEEQSLKTPSHMALIHEGKQLTYQELNEKSNQLAAHLRKQYMQRTNQPLAPDTRVALFLDRSLEMIIGIMAVLKSGGAYVPLDPLSPQSKINYILEDTQVELVLTQKHLNTDGYSQLPQETIVYIDLSQELYVDEDKSNLPNHSKAVNLAYTLFTSGTTGKPKGVSIKHSAVSNLINFHNKRYAALSANLQVALVSSYNFDFSIQQLFNTILFGHTLHVLSRDCILNPSQFNDYLITNEIEVFEMTPTSFSYLILPFNNYEYSKLKLINIGGESLSSSIISDFLAKNIPADISIINTYGPTEFTVDATSYEIDCNLDSFVNHESVFIGKPIDNSRAYILDGSLNPVPVGVVGELYLGGAGLAEGYLNLPELTNSSFVKNPFATHKDLMLGYKQLYKTGDLVRWMSDGNIEYIGRNDFQVKIRGYRIELGEIENTLISIEEISQACVLAKEKNGNEYLVAYYIVESAITEEKILNRLIELLPDYMVPSLLVQLEQFPLTINGKLDRKQLPDPEFTSTDPYLAPTSDMEIALCRVWQNVLDIDTIGICDNFFRIGGNSILAIKLSHQINKALDTATVVADIFNYKTVQQLSNYILSLVVEEEYIEIEL
ncbi:amino acid adenylation domain-containing protein [Flavivirga jejuensis]|uniref:amino acid adenylation domain-containing protein n=1 Tax=Flavivirga jejuensis TaxID=870487 RepID=UPI0031EF2039